MATRTVRTLAISIGQVEAGHLAWFSDGRGIFQFADSYQAMGPQRPVLSLSFTQPGNEAATVEKLSRAYARTVRLPPFFRNLLPEGVLRERMARLLGTSIEDEIGLLEGLGLNLPGAVIARRDDTPAKLERLARAGPQAGKHEAKGELFSLGGAQLKSVMLRHEGRFSVRKSRDQPGEEWIVKPPHAVYPRVPENEYWMMSLARELGIDTPEIELVPIDRLDFGEGTNTDFARGERYAYAVQRFDRAGGSRIHIEDFAQVFGVDPEQEYSATNYDSIGNLIFHVFPDRFDQLAEFVKRLTLMIILGNSDAHLKNWSVIYRDGRSPALSPIYDVVSTVQYVSANRGMALNIRREKEFARLQLDHFARMAKRIDVASGFVVGNVRSTVERAREVWPSFKRHLPKKLASNLMHHWSTLNSDFKVA